MSFNCIVVDLVLVVVVVVVVTFIVVALHGLLNFNVEKCAVPVLARSNQDLTAQSKRFLMRLWYAGYVR